MHASTVLSNESTPLPGPEVLENVVDLGHNDRTVCLLNESGKTFCWWNNVSGTSGVVVPPNEANYENLNSALNNDIADISLGDTHLCGFGKTAGINCQFFGNPQTDLNPGLENPPEPDASYIAMSSIATSDLNLCAIQTDNRTVCWGFVSETNAVPPEAQYLKQVDVHVGRACGVDLNNDLVCWGTTTIGPSVDPQFGNTDPNTIDNIKQISMGDFGSCVINLNDELQCFGGISRFTQSYAGRKFRSVNTQSNRGPVMCFEETNGNRACEWVTSVDGVIQPPRSILPEGTTELAFASLNSSICFITTDENMECFSVATRSEAQFPPAPANLRLETYAENSIELFWDRPGNLSNLPDYVSGYEIYKNDELVARTDVITSYFDNMSDAQTTYSVRPVRGAIAGPAATINRTADTDPVTPTPPTTPTTPVTVGAPIITGSVYSPTQQEIVWKIANNPDVRFDVFRDNVPLVRGTSAQSFFSDDLEPGTTYVWGVSAVLNGNTVGASSISLTTTGERTTPASNAPNFSGSSRYSSNTVELFWVRTPNTFTQYYELSRNGVVIAELDALSYLDRQAASNQAWTYELVAVDANGNRSDAGSITVEASDSTEPTTPTQPTTPIEPVAPVGNISAPILTGATYSPTTIEIFWNRSSNPNVRYNVFRDNVPVLTNTDVLSFYDTNLAPGTSYTYGVATVLNGDTVAASGNTFTTRAIEGVEPELKDRPLFSGASRYSMTSVEIFWVRTPNVFTAYYELSRNGEIINAQLDALSYFDNTAPNNQTWTYTLVSIDADGNRSEPSTIIVEPMQL